MVRWARRSGKTSLFAIFRSLICASRQESNLRRGTFRRSIRPPLTGFPFSHLALQLTALKFAMGDIFWNLVDKLVSQPPPCPAKRLLIVCLRFGHSVDHPEREASSLDGSKEIAERCDYTRILRWRRTPVKRQGNRNFSPRYGLLNLCSAPGPGERLHQDQCRQFPTDGRLSRVRIFDVQFCRINAIGI